MPTNYTLIFYFHSSYTQKSPEIKLIGLLECAIQNQWYCVKLPVKLNDVKYENAFMHNLGNTSWENGKEVDLNRHL